MKCKNVIDKYLPPSLPPGKASLRRPSHDPTRPLCPLHPSSHPSLHRHFIVIVGVHVLQSIWKDACV